MSRQDKNVSKEKTNIILPDGWKSERGRNKIENPINNDDKKKITSISGQKMRITVKYMKERRSKRWTQRMDWLAEDLDRLVDIRDANPEDVQDFSLPMVILGSDVAALYPSLDTDKVAELVYQAVKKSKIEWSNIDYMEATRYIAFNWDSLTCQRSKLRRILPVRRHKNGSRPGVTGIGPLGPDTGDTEQWIFKKVTLTKDEKREVIATVVKIITKAMFKTHVYSFGGKVYRQVNGGPIGLRSTCSVARLVMKVWDDKWLENLKNLMVKIEEATRYMDDGRTAMYRFRHGWRKQ